MGTRLSFGLAAGAAALAGLAILALAPVRASGQAPVQAESGPLSGSRAQDGQDSKEGRLDPSRVHEARKEAERRHLVRVGTWGLANVAGGAALALSRDRDEDPGLHGFGVQSAGWGLVNVAIASAGLGFGGRGDPPETAREALESESRWGQILVLNQGLNVGYMMAGGALIWAGGRGVDRGPELRGHGSAVVLQGLGLFVLDGVAWLGHRHRMDDLLEALDEVRISVGPMGNGAAGVAVRVPLGTP